MDDHYNLYYIFLWDFERTTIPEPIKQDILNFIETMRVRFNSPPPPEKQS